MRLKDITVCVQIGCMPNLAINLEHLSWALFGECQSCRQIP